jgi:hypothetical protein
MAMTDSQKTSNVYKKLLGVAETNTTKDFFEEPFQSSIIVTPDMIWRDAGDIPFPAPDITPTSQIDLDTGETLVFGNNGGVVSYYLWVPLRPVSGSPKAFYHPVLRNAIPFNFDTNGTYAFRLRNSNNFDIAFGVQDWIVDPVAGTLTFYGSNLASIGVDVTHPPKITFYRYIGRTGLPTGSGTGADVPMPDSTILLYKTSQFSKQAQFVVNGAVGTSQYVLPAIPGKMSSNVLLEDTLNQTVDAIGVIDGGEV